MYCTVLLSMCFCFSEHLLHIVLKASNRISVRTESSITVSTEIFLCVCVGVCVCVCSVPNWWSVTVYVRDYSLLVMCNSRKKIRLYVTYALLRRCWELNTDVPVFEVSSFACPRQQINRLSDCNQILPCTFSSDWIRNMTRLHKYRSVMMDFANIGKVRLTANGGMNVFMSVCDRPIFRFNICRTVHRNIFL